MEKTCVLQEHRQNVKMGQFRQSAELSSANRPGSVEASGRHMVSMQAKDKDRRQLETGSINMSVQAEGTLQWCGSIRTLLLACTGETGTDVCD